MTYKKPPEGGCKFGGLRRTFGLEKLKDGQYLKFKQVVCVHNQEIVYQLDDI